MKEGKLYGNSVDDALSVLLDHHGEIGYELRLTDDMTNPEEEGGSRMWNIDTYLFYQDSRLQESHGEKPEVCA